MVWVWASGDEGRTWEKLSEVDNEVIKPGPLADYPEALRRYSVPDA